MLTVLAMATQVGAASHGDPRGFILAFVVFHAIVVALFLRAARLYPGRHAFSIRYASGFGLAAAIWLVSLALPEEIRPWVWVVALAVDLVTPWMAVLTAAERTFDVSHIPERYGLFTIIVLGEAIIAVARSMSEAQWTPEAVTAAVAGFAIAVVIWWAYFAHPHAELLERGRLASFIWGYGHIFVWMGIAITGVGIELAIEAAAAGHALVGRRAAHPLWGSGAVPDGDGALALGGRRPFHRSCGGDSAGDGGRVRRHLARRRGVVAAGSHRPDGCHGRRRGDRHWACLEVRARSRNLNGGWEGPGTRAHRANWLFDGAVRSPRPVRGGGCGVEKARSDMDRERGA